MFKECHTDRLARMIESEALKIVTATAVSHAFTIILLS